MVLRGVVRQYWQMAVHGIVCLGNGAKLGVPSGGGRGDSGSQVWVRYGFSFLNRIFAMQYCFRAQLCCNVTQKNIVFRFTECTMYIVHCTVR